MKNHHTKRKSQQGHIFLLILALFSFFTIIWFGLGFLSLQVAGANVTSDSSFITMNVTNTEPIIYNVTFNTSSITLTPGNRTTVNCTASIWDYNSVNDIVVVNATLYDRSASTNDATDDDNFHYTNRTCNLNSTIGGSNTNASFVCLFGVNYFTNNGSWVCNVTTMDGANISSSNNAELNVETLLAIDVPTTTSYGNTSVNSYTGSNITVTNVGNVDFNITLLGYGSNDAVTGNETSFLCELGNITITNHRFSYIDTNWSTMTPLNYSSRNLGNITFPQRQNDTDYGPDRNNTIWRVYIPNSIGGFCNGTVVFNAVQAE